MTDISYLKLRQLDLTLLLVFLALHRHRNATRVAAELGLTQPAISHALKRLRAVFGDELFLRRPHGLEPTAVALMLEPEIDAAVAHLRGALGRGDAFEPASAQGAVRINALDLEQSVLLSGLLARIATAAPGLTLMVAALRRPAALDALVAGTCEIALGFFPQPGEAFAATPLLDDDYAVVGRPDVIGQGGAIGLQHYLDARHIIVSPGGDLRGIVDAALDLQGHKRRVVAAFPQFLPVLAALSETGCIATMPGCIARKWAATFGLALVPAPVALRRLTISAVVHRRNAKDPRLGWITGQLRAVAAAASA
jgi:DNA-binding transcriptional LysR family regulator